MVKYTHLQNLAYLDLVYQRRSLDMAVLAGFDRNQIQKKAL